MRQHIDRVKAMTETTLSKSENNLIWIDLEMTGLKPESDRIIEIAVVVTDPLLTVRVEGPVFAIHQSDATLDAMDAWNKGTHGKSGLIAGQGLHHRRGPGQPG
jgi:oligoribonuclease